MSVIDLHIHSGCSSDGEFEPGELVRQSMEQGMELIAIADHNSVRGVAEALAAADGRLHVIPAVELDCTYRGRNFHLLGYGFDYTGKEFKEVEHNIAEQERNASEEKIRLFSNATGIQVNMAEVIRAARDGIVTGELVAEHVLAGPYADGYELLRPYLPGGEKSDMPNVRIYWDFFSEGKPAYVPIHYLSLADAAALIHRWGGVTVLAHPGQNLAGDNWLLPDMIKDGIDGIEVFSSYHGVEDTAAYLEFAGQYELFVTCGSDFHGKHKPAIGLGGHGALWEDERIKEQLKACGGFAPWI